MSQTTQTQMFKFELKRKLFHIIVGSLGVFLIYIGIIDPLIIFMVLVAGILASFISRYGDVPIISWFLKEFERPEVIKRFPGRSAMFLCIAFLLTLKLFPLDIALASLMILTFGDSMSNLVGRFFGKTKNPLNGFGYKLIEGTIAGVFAGFLGAVIFISPIQAFLASSAAMLTEAIEIDFNKKPLDDNIIVPLVAGTIILAIQENWFLLVFNFLKSFWVF